MTPTPNQHPDGRTVSGFSSAAVLAGLCALAAVSLSGCETTSGQLAMPEPKYPIYMQDKPAEAPQPAEQASSAMPASTPPAVMAQGSGGAVTTTDLAPPPPPPPPETSSSSSSSDDDMPVATPVTAPVKDTRAAFVYVLQAHDTLYGVSRRFGIPVKDLYDINGLSPTTGLRIGQRILLPVTATDKGVDAHANGEGMVKLAAALARPSAAVKPPAVKHPIVEADTDNTPPAKPVVAPQATAVASTASTAPDIAGFPSNAQLTRMGKGMFVWPVHGKMLVPFGQLAPNVRNDGVNIGAEQGTDVKASADGVVVYEGNQVKELGNTVYIKHANGWYTGYSHLDTMTVKNNEQVTKGEVIGTVGQTGVIDQPQLHFEIRYTPSKDIARPIDPDLVLP